MQAILCSGNVPSWSTSYILSFHLYHFHLIYFFHSFPLIIQVNLDMTDSMGPGKLVRLIHMTNTCIRLGPCISSVICKNLSYSGPSYPSSPVYSFPICSFWAILSLQYSVSLLVNLDFHLPCLLFTKIYPSPGPILWFPHSHRFVFCRHWHKYLPACPNKWIKKRALEQVHYSLHLPKWAIWFYEHYTCLYRKWHKYPEIWKHCNKTKKKMVFNYWIHAMVNNTKCDKSKN